MKRYAIVIEKAGDNFSGYVPDLPGCVSTGESIDETRSSLRDAVELHIDGLMDDLQSIPEPTTYVNYLDVRTE